MSIMNIFIIGPVGAGKTVFSYMLNRHVSKHDKHDGHNISFKVSDWNTKAHLASIGQSLEAQEWPPGGGPGKLTSLEWEWEFAGRTAHFRLIDPPGEAIQSELRGDSDKLRILESIHSADILFIILDLHEHQGEPPLKRTQNAWIVENCLKSAYAAQRIVLGVSKGDVLAHLVPVESWQDKGAILELIEAHMPEFNLAAYQATLSGSDVEVVMFSAVTHTENKVDESGALRKVPGTPLESHGLNPFVSAIIEGKIDKDWQEFINRWRRRIIKVMSSKYLWGGIIAIVTVRIIFHYVYWWVKSA